MYESIHVHVHCNHLRFTPHLISGLTITNLTNNFYSPLPEVRIENILAVVRDSLFHNGYCAYQGHNEKEIL
jgi:hypothetical protein